jgi:hypothetical protein
MQQIRKKHTLARREESLETLISSKHIFKMKILLFIAIRFAILLHDRSRRRNPRPTTTGRSNEILFDKDGDAMTIVGDIDAHQYALLEFVEKVEFRQIADIAGEIPFLLESCEGSHTDHHRTVTGTEHEAELKEIQ